jgi:hypothetical protein
VDINNYPSWVFNRRILVRSKIIMDERNNSCAASCGSGVFVPGPLPTDRNRSPYGSATSVSSSAAATVCVNHVNCVGNGNGNNGNKKRTESLSGNPEEDNILLHSFDYIRSLPGKQVRSKLSVAFNYWLKVDPERLEKICDIVELLHNASLL